MTLTAEHIDAVLPRVPAGIASGDLTEPDERAEFIGWLHELYQRAALISVAGPDDDIHATVEWLRTVRASKETATESPRSDKTAPVALPPPDPAQRVQRPTWTDLMRFMRDYAEGDTK